MPPPGFDGCAPLMTWMAVAVDTLSVARVLMLALGGRFLAIAAVGYLAGRLVGSVPRATLATVFGVLLADIAWVIFLVTCFSMSWDDF